MVVTDMFYGKKSPIVGTYTLIDDGGEKIGHAIVLNQDNKLKVISSDNLSKKNKQAILTFVCSSFKN